MATIFDVNFFNGSHFRRWQYKILFNLHVQNLDCMLHENALRVDENVSDYATIINKRKRLDFICRGEILKAMVDSLFDFFVSCKTAHDLWMALERIYLWKETGATLPINTKVVDDALDFTISPICFYRGEKFNDKNYKRWQQKISFHLAALNVDHMLSENAFDVDGNVADYAAVIEKRKEEDDICRNHLLWSMEDLFYDLYSHYKTAYELWDYLEKMHSWKSPFLVSNYLRYKIVSDKPVLAQVYELQTIVYRIMNDGMELCWDFQLFGILDKLPASWKEFGLSLDSVWKEITLEELLARIRIEEEKQKRKWQEGKRKRKWRNKRRRLR